MSDPATRQFSAHEVPIVIQMLLATKELGEADTARLHRIERLVAEDGRLRMDQVLEQAFDGIADQQAALRKLRQRIRIIGEEMDHNISLEVDNLKSHPPSERWLWFSGTGDLRGKESEFAERSVPVSPYYRPERYIQQSGSTPMTLFISYAHAQGFEADVLAEELRKAFDHQVPNIKLWVDKEIPVGHDWEATILQNLEDATYGLLFLSPGFFKSRFIREKELAALYRKNKFLPVAVVGSSEEELTSIDWLPAKQIYYYPEFKHKALLAFADCDGKEARHRFVNGLVERVLQRHHHDKQKPKNTINVASEADATDPDDPYCGPIHIADRKGYEAHKYFHIRGNRHGIDQNRLQQEVKERPSGQADIGNVLDHLLAWVADKDAKHQLFALLGDYGTGKTFTTRMLTNQLNQLHVRDTAQPMAVYVDLRMLPPYIDGRTPTLEEILTEAIRVSEVQNVSADMLIDLARLGSAVMIFDGLDEKTVHMKDVDAQNFFNELLRVFPPKQALSTAEPAGSAMKVIFTCRAHYFPSTFRQDRYFTQQGRDRAKGEDYACCLLLPFDESQVLGYLKQQFGQKRAEAIQELINDIHNLSDVASRPMGLAQITEFIPELEAKRARQEKVNAASLYQLMLEQAFTRDDGKHTFLPRHKQILMQDLAASFWRSGERSWPSEKVEEWLDAWLYDNPKIAKRYQTKAPELLEEDLRTATFIVRGEDDGFRFAHTSLQEFFLASYLKRGMEEDRWQAWNMETPSQETLRFLGQLLDLERSSNAIQNLSNWLDAGREPVKLIGLLYWLIAHGDRLPTPIAHHPDFSGVERTKLHFVADAARPLKFANSIWRNASLPNSRWQHVDLRGADFSGANLSKAELDHCRIDQARFDDTVIAGTVFHQCSGGDDALRHAQAWHSEWSGDSGQHWQNAPNWLVLSSAAEGRYRARPTPPPHPLGPPRCLMMHPTKNWLLVGYDSGVIALLDAASGHVLRLFVGHSGGVSACAWKPDGSAFLSASYDLSLLLWDPNSSSPKAAFNAHSAPVSACAWKPDGSAFLSASDDLSLLLWDPDSTSPKATFNAHSAPVSACAWKPDGSAFLSASYDNSLLLWDPNSFSPKAAFKAHTEGVTACAWKPDGSAFLSASHDDSLLLWDPNSASPKAAFNAHSGSVTACAWKPDGSAFLSASFGNFLLLWDPNSSSPKTIFKAQANWVRACAWKPDGSAFLSASDDNSLLLWDPNSSSPKTTFEAQTNWVRACAWKPDGSVFLSAFFSASFDNFLILWDPNSSSPKAAFKAHSLFDNACAWKPDGSAFLSSSSDNSLMLWDPNSASPKAAFKAHTDSVSACAWNPDGSVFLSASRDKSLLLWDPNSFSPKAAFKAHTEGVTACAWKPDGSAFLSASYDHSLMLWDPNSASPKATFKAHTGWVAACAWKPDGSAFLSASSDHSLMLWDPNSASPKVAFKAHTSGVTACAWKPDGSAFLSASYDSSLILWDPNSASPKATFKAHTAGVKACAWKPDGKTFLSAGNDGQVIHWDAETGAILKRYLHFPGGEYAIIDEVQGTIDAATEGAWRYLRWRVEDEDGFLLHYPAEMNGPLPLVPYPKGAG